MKLTVPVRELGRVDTSVLTEAVRRAGESAWEQETLRQDRYEQHRDTQSLILCFCEGWPQLKMIRGPAWETFYNPAAPLVHEVLERGYERGGKVVRMMMARLKPGGEIALHRDTHPSFAIGHRIHVPLTTNDQVEFEVGGLRHELAEGRAYEIDNLRKHRVANGGSEARIHFIMDYVPPAALM